MSAFPGENYQVSHSWTEWAYRNHVYYKPARPRRPLRRVGTATAVLTAGPRGPQTSTQIGARSANDPKAADLTSTWMDSAKRSRELPGPRAHRCRSKARCPDCGWTALARGGVEGIRAAGSDVDPGAGHNPRSQPIQNNHSVSSHEMTGKVRETRLTAVILSPF